MRIKSAAVAAFACLSLGAFGEVAPQLPPSSYLDTEVSTNLALNQNQVGVAGLNLRLEFAGTSSNNVEVVIGTDADGDGELSFDESGMRLRWDCGHYFIERVATGERFEETRIGTNDLARVLDWQCMVKRHRIKALEISNEAGAAFADVTTNVPGWFYDGNWNLMRLTARGVDVPNERFVYEVTQRGHLLILR